MFWYLTLNVQTISANISANNASEVAPPLKPTLIYYILKDN